MKSFLLSMFLVFVSIVSFSQSGVVRGKIIDAQSGEALIGATVVVAGTTNGTITDFDGNYNLKLDAGTYNISVSYVSYETQTFEGVEIKAGDVTIVNANLGEATTALEEVVVTARSRQRTETAIQVMQRKSAVVMDGISSQQISKLGDSDAAGALKRVTGVSVEGGKYVYVRGLSDRYSKITLNGAEIPGLDPNRNTVQMDLFPSNVIENMVVHKTFSPDLPGSSTGGHIDIITKDFPEKFTFQFSSSFGYNKKSNLNDNFLTSPGGDKDWLGYDDGTRKDRPEIPEGGLPSIYAANDSLITQFGEQFNKNFSQIREQKPINQTYSLSVGNQVDFLGKQLGFILAGSYDRDYTYYGEGTYNQFKNAIDAENISPYWLLADDNGQENVIWSGLVNLSYKLSNYNKIGFNFMKNQSGTSNTRYSRGSQPEEDRLIENRTYAYLERGLTSYQLKGEHVLPGLNNAKIEWLSSYTLSIQNEPDLRFFYNDYTVDSETGEITGYSVRTNRESKRFFREMDESNFDNHLDMTFPFDFNGQKSSFKMGGAYLKKSRNSDEVVFTISANNEIDFNGDPLDFLKDENIYNQDNKWTGQYYYYKHSDLTDLINSYKATQKVLGAYAMFDMKFTDKLRAVLGVRLEDNEINTNNKVDTLNYRVDKYKEGTINETEILPALNITYSVIEEMNFRFSFSKTVARPSFREIAPYASYDHKSGFRTIGNNDSLRSSLVTNLDFRWEYFFAPGEMISISTFYKYFENPIELIDNPDAANKEVSYINGQNSDLYGFEIEARKKLAFVDFLKDFSLGANYSYIKSVVKETDAFLEAARANVPEYPAEREMFGQSPYLVNAFISYSNENIGLSSNLSYNVAGEKIIILNKTGVPNIYEMPYSLMNFNISKTFAENITIKFSAKNLLNSVHEQLYKSDKIEEVFRRYSYGRDFSLSLTYLIK